MEQTIDFALLERVAHKIETLPDPRLFNMDSTTSYPECGTAHCIGGWICQVKGVDFPACFKAQELAGLTEKQGDYLFYPEDNDGFGGWEATPAQGAAKIRKFIKDNQTSQPPTQEFTEKKPSLFERFFDWFENL